MKRPDRRLALCAVYLLASLLLPFAVFRLWDHILLGSPHAQESAAGELSAAGRADPTACTLYNGLHLTGISPTGTDTYEGWAEVPVDNVDRRRLTSLLADMKAAGLLSDAQYRLAVSTANAGAVSGQSYTAPGGLHGYSSCLSHGGYLQIPESSISFYYLESGAPVFLQISSPEPTGFGSCDVDDAYAQALLQVLELDHFADWQPVEWQGRAPAAGAAAYSAEAQLYLTVTEQPDGLTFSLNSLTPQELVRLYGQEVTS